MAEPQAGNSIDYGALAQRARGVDYSALASQARSGKPPATDPNQGKYGHTGYKSSLPWPLSRVDEAVSDSVDAMGEGLRKVLHGTTADERLGGASQILHGFANSAGVPLVMEAGVAAPLRTALGLGVGAAVQTGASKTAEALGAGEGTSQFIGDAAGLLAGGKAAKSGPEAIQATRTAARVATNPEVVRAAVDVLPKGSKFLKLMDAIKAAKEGAPPAAEAPPPPPPSPGEAYAQARGIDWDALSAEDRGVLEHVAQAQQNAAAAPPRPTAPPPQQAPGTTSTGGRGVTLQQLLQEEVYENRDARRARSMPPETGDVNKAVPVRPPLATGVNVPLRPPMAQAPQVQLPPETPQPAPAVSTAPEPATPAPPAAIATPAPEPAPAPKPPSLAQTEAAMAQKKPAPLEEPRSMYTETGERKSPHLRAAEIENANRLAKVDRIIKSLTDFEIGSEDVRNMGPKEWDQFRQATGINAPSEITRGMVIDRLRKIERERAKATAPQKPAKPDPQEIARQLRDEMERSGTLPSK